MIKIEAADYECAFAQLCEMLLAQTKSPLKLALTAEDKQWRVEVKLRPPKARKRARAA